MNTVREDYRKASVREACQWLFSHLSILAGGKEKPEEEAWSVLGRKKIFVAEHPGFVLCFSSLAK